VQLESFMHAANRLISCYWPDCRLDAWQLNVEQLLSNMEAIKQQGLVFAALKSGNAAASQMQKDVTVADVEALLQNSAAAQAKQQEIQVCFSNAKIACDFAPTRKLCYLLNPEAHMQSHTYAGTLGFIDDA
jgi:hypothetical protein